MLSKFIDVIYLGGSFVGLFLSSGSWLYDGVIYNRIRIPVYLLEDVRNRCFISLCWVVDLLV